MASQPSKPKRRKKASNDPAEPKPVKKKVIKKDGYVVRGKAAEKRMCRWCYGAGKLDGYVCTWCNGAGYVKG